MLFCRPWIFFFFFNYFFSNKSFRNTIRVSNSLDPDWPNILKLFFPENSIRHFMQIILTGDNLHEMSGLITGKNNFKMLSAEIFTQHAKYIYQQHILSWTRNKEMFCGLSEALICGEKVTTQTVLYKRCASWSGYHIYPKYSDTSTPYHICSKIWTSTIYYPMLCQKIAGWMTNSVDPVETPRSAASHLGLNCLLRPACPNTYGKYGNCCLHIHDKVCFPMASLI